MLLERLGTAAMPSDQIRKLLGRAARLAAMLSGSPEERAKLVRKLVDNVIVDERTLTIKLRRALLFGADLPASASGDCSNNAVELIEAVAFKQRGAETKLVLPGLAQQNDSSRCDPALVKAIARGRACLRSSPPAAPDRCGSWPGVTAFPGATFAGSLALPS
jgi:hypothetical protein